MKRFAAMFTLSIAGLALAIGGCASPGKRIWHPTPTGVNTADSTSSGPGSRAERAPAPRMANTGYYRHGRAGGSVSKSRARISYRRSSTPPPAPSLKPTSPAPTGSGESRGSRGAPARRPLTTTTTPTHRPHLTPRPTLRPGLGTVFGERRYSVVRYVGFRRASSRPSAMASIHYNDFKGLSAMVQRLRRRCCGTLGARTVTAGVTVTVVDSFGRSRRGAIVGDKAIVLGRHGERYSIRVRNNTGRRYEIVASVDGLDVIDGRRASVTKRGYILRGYQTLKIDGFRTSRATVAAFRFGSVRNSYVARTTGAARNVGVIGVALFSERGPTQDEIDKRLKARPFSDSGYANPPSVRY